MNPALRISHCVHGRDAAENVDVHVAVPAISSTSFVFEVRNLCFVLAHAVGHAPTFPSASCAMPRFVTVFRNQLPREQVGSVLGLDRIC